MISERSCETEDCWKFSFNFTGISYSLNYVKTYNNISQYYGFYYIFDQINVISVSIWDFFQKGSVWWEY